VGSRPPITPLRAREDERPDDDRRVVGAPLEGYRDVEPASEGRRLGQQTLAESEAGHDNAAGLARRDEPDASEQYGSVIGEPR
jgi:hypothetical protein